MNNPTPLSWDDDEAMDAWEKSFNKAVIELNRLEKEPPVNVFNVNVLPKKHD